MATGPWIPTDRNVCLNISLRQPRSFDFLACEGYHGWSATHEMFPFVLMIFFNDIPMAWIFSGFVEIFEILRPALFGDQALFDANPTNYETHAGAIIGDWLFNDLFGILSAALLIRLLGIPGLMDPWYKHTWPVPNSQRPRMFAKMWWKIHGLFLVFLFLNIAPSWVTPEGCDLHVPYDCLNIGLIISVCGQLLVIALGGIWFLRTRDEKRDLWGPRGVSRTWLNAYFVFWFLFIFLVGAQNAQWIVPIWFIPTIGEFAQVWLATAFWIMLVLIYYAITKEEDFARPTTRRNV